MKRALFIQVSEPGAYPPLIHAAHLMARAGWQVCFLSAPVTGSVLRVPAAPGITVVEMPERPSFVVPKRFYARYGLRAVALARHLRPDVVYASDPIGALPGVLAAKASGATLIYHEHDSPTDESHLNGWVRKARHRALRGASLAVFPNAERADHALKQVRFDPKRLRVVWNTPRLDELPRLADVPPRPFVLYYHGSINPERLPKTVVHAVASFDGAIRLDFAGYEAPGAKGHIESLLAENSNRKANVARYLGEIQHRDLLNLASRCHAGLSLMPMRTTDINMRHMVGASNKAFDYMSAGIPIIVSDLPDWRSQFVDTGFGICCNPEDEFSIRQVLHELIRHPGRTRDMGLNCRAHIESHWNYEVQFASVLKHLSTAKK